MTDATPQIQPDAPVWARDDAFPQAPASWGWMDAKGNSHPCQSIDELIRAIREDPDGAVTLAWTPENTRMVLPEEIPGAAEAVRAARDRWTRGDLEDGTRVLTWYSLALGGFTAYAFFQGLVRAPAMFTEPLQRVLFAFQVVFRSPTIGLALLMFVIFGFIPWYQARKRRRQMGMWNEAGIAAIVPTLRFETWLERQKAPVTRAFLGLIILVWLAQLLPGDAIKAAGLVKSSYLKEDWWRLMTAPFLHGNIVHLLMNLAAMAYLGKRVEVFARWPHLPMVFLFAACIGGEASARFIAADSVGASGGLMGWLGFLLIFETLHARLVPRRARRRLAAGVLLTALIGLIGYRFIDNAAHAGGLFAGMLYAAVVFPKSSSPYRPKTTLTDRIAGSLAGAFLIFAALTAIWKITGPK